MAAMPGLSRSWLGVISAGRALAGARRLVTYRRDLNILHLTGLEANMEKNVR
jgi:hypothetical protein